MTQENDIKNLWHCVHCVWIYDTVLTVYGPMALCEPYMDLWHSVNRVWIYDIVLTVYGSMTLCELYVVLWHCVNCMWFYDTVSSAYLVYESNNNVLIFGHLPI